METMDTKGTEGYKDLKVHLVEMGYLDSQGHPDRKALLDGKEIEDHKD